MSNQDLIYSDLPLVNDDIYDENTDNEFVSNLPELVSFIKSCYDDGKNNKNKSEDGNPSLNELIKQSEQQFNGLLDEKVKEKIEKNNLSDKVINFTKLKTTALYAWIKDILSGIIDYPIEYKITPISELNETEKEQLAIDIINELMLKSISENNFNPENIENIVKNSTDEFLKQKQNIAEKSLSRLSKLIKDQLIEAKFGSILQEFLFNFALYPFAVIEGPIEEIDYIRSWKKNKIISEKKVIYKNYNIHPKDIFFSEDCETLQDCSFCIINKSYNYLELKNMLNSDNDDYNKSDISKLIKRIENYIDNKQKNITYNESDKLSFLNNDIYSFDYNINNIYSENIPAIKYYGKIAGLLIEDLLEKNQSKYEYYECEIIACNNYIIKISIKDNLYKRPVYGISFQKQNNKFYGFGIPRLIRDVEQIYHIELRALLLNTQFSCAPAYEGIKEYTELNEHGKPQTLESGKITPVNGNLTGNGFPVYYAHHTPIIGNAILPILSYFSNLIDLISCIPAVVHGMPIGSGANRTYKGMLTLYSNALKAIQSAIDDIDKYVLIPFADNMYFKNLIDYENVPDNFKSDCNIQSFGIYGIVKKEINEDKITSDIEKLISLRDRGLVNEQILDDKIKELLNNMGYFDSNNVEEMQQKQANMVNNSIMQKNPETQNTANNPYIQQLQGQR